MPKHQFAQQPNQRFSPFFDLLLYMYSGLCMHRVNTRKLKVYNIPSEKLVKKGDRLSGTITRCGNYLSKHTDEHIDPVLLAGTNDLASRNVSPDELIKRLDESISELTAFQNLHHIFICQLPLGFDFHNVNSKVIRFNELLLERFPDTEEFVTVLDPVPAEFRFYHHDGLHLSDMGLSNLYKILTPASYKKRKTRKSSGMKHGNTRRFNKQ